jgi:hypothetical protein
MLTNKILFLFVVQVFFTSVGSLNYMYSPLPSNCSCLRYFSNLCLARCSRSVSLAFARAKSSNVCKQG